MRPGAAGAFAIADPAFRDPEGQGCRLVIGDSEDTPGAEVRNQKSGVRNQKSEGGAGTCSAGLAL